MKKYRVKFVESVHRESIISHDEMLEILKENGVEPDFEDLPLEEMLLEILNENSEEYFYLVEGTDDGAGEWDVEEVK